MISNRDAAYVAVEVIPPSAPPAPKAGVIHWLRRNLFNGVIDSILTLISVTLIVLIVPPLIDWAVLKGVWNANSLDQCQQIVVATHGEGAHGACWAVINERIYQFIFGFYPPDLYWRPVLAFVLLFVAIAPVLFSSFPRKMLWFSLAYPVIAYFLIWGGLSLEPVHSSRVGGIILTITLAVAGIALALPLGIVLALGRNSSMFVFRTICASIIEVIRGVPLIILLFAPFLFLAYALPPGTIFDLILRLVLVLAFAAAAYMAEVIRASLTAIPSGQYQAAAALGLNTWKAKWLIILPQALRTSMPRIVRICVRIFRDTSLVAVIGLLDPVGLLNPIRATAQWNGIVWELFAVVILFYWVFSFAISSYGNYLERKLKAEHSRHAPAQ